MSQNTSSAVMQQRKEPHDSLDFFPTPPWATRALCDQLELSGLSLPPKSVWEPACGEGHMARPLAERFGTVYASDIHPYGFGEVEDFLFPGAPRREVDWIITNPPFRLGAQFIARSLEIAETGVAVLVRTSFLEGMERYAEIFGPSPPWAVMQFCERVPMVKGRYDPKASTATSYCWIVWRKHLSSATRFIWIPPCKKRLEKPSDWEGTIE